MDGRNEMHSQQYHGRRHHQWSMTGVDAIKFIMTRQCSFIFLEKYSTTVSVVHFSFTTLPIFRRVFKKFFDGHVVLFLLLIEFETLEREKDILITSFTLNSLIRR